MTSLFLIARPERVCVCVYIQRAREINKVGLTVHPHSLACVLEKLETHNKEMEFFKKSIQAEILRLIIHTNTLPTITT